MRSVFSFQGNSKHFWAWRAGPRSKIASVPLATQRKQLSLPRRDALQKGPAMHKIPTMSSSCSPNVNAIVRRERDSSATFCDRVKRLRDWDAFRAQGGILQRRIYGRAQPLSAQRSFVSCWECLQIPRGWVLHDPKKLPNTQTVGVDVDVADVRNWPNSQT